MKKLSEVQESVFRAIEDGERLIIMGGYWVLDKSGRGVSVATVRALKKAGYLRVVGCSDKPFAIEAVPCIPLYTAVYDSPLKGLKVGTYTRRYGRWIDELTRKPDLCIEDCCYLCEVHVNRYVRA